MVDKLTKVEINGVDVSSYIVNYESPDTVESDYTVARIILYRRVLDVVDINSTQDVVIYRGSSTSTDYTIFRGEIAEQNRTYGTETIEVVAYDKLWSLDRQLITYSFDKNIDSEAGVISAIWDTIVTDGGLTTSVVDSSTYSNPLSKFICNNQSRYERATRLARLLNWQQRFDPNSGTGVAHFEPKGYINSGVTLQTGVNIVAVPEWNYNYDNMCNRVTVIGGMNEVETTETFDGNASTTGFSLTYEPMSTKVFISSVLKTGGVPDGTASYDYWIDSKEKKLYFVDAPAAGTGNIEVRYSYNEPISVSSRNADSVTTYGEFRKCVTDTQILTVADAEEKAARIIQTQGLPFVSANLKITNVYGLVAGHIVSVVDDIHGENRDLVVKKINYLYPEPYDEVEVGDEEWKLGEYLVDVNDRLTKLEREMSGVQSLLRHIEDFQNDIDCKTRYFKVQSQNTGTGWIWGRDNTVWGTTVWGEAGTGAVITERVGWPLNTFRETFYDNDFLTSDSGSGSFQTGTGLVFTGSGNCVSPLIFNDAVAVTSADFTATFTGTGTFYLRSGTGNDWESVSLTSGDTTSHTFSNSGSGVWYKVAYSGTGTVSDVSIKMNPN